MPEWMVLEYLPTCGASSKESPVRFYTKNGFVDTRHYKKVGEAETREGAQSIVWENDPEMLKRLGLSVKKG